MAAKASKPKRIAVLMSIDRSFRRGLMSGICAFAQPQHNWELRLLSGSSQTLPILKQIKPDGIISHVASTTFARKLMQLKVPVVNCSSRAPLANLPTVCVDNVAVGKMAKEFFQKRDFKNYALCGRVQRPGTRSRGQAFEKAVLGAGFTFRKFMRWKRVTDAGQESWLDSDHIGKLRRWLTALPRPVAIFCSDDMVAIQTIAACKDAGLNVPDDVAVLGVDNDEVLCQMVSPQASSIKLAQEEIGYHAAALLDRLIKKELLPDNKEECHKIFAPVEVATRASTDMIAVDDFAVAKAMQFIRENRSHYINVQDVAEASHVSRRTLELRFRKILNRSVASQIRQSHVNQARWLLRDTNWTIEKIAPASGYRSADRLTVAFKNETGQTPGQYRRRFVNTLR